MPVRLAAPTPDFAHLRIYDRYDWGRLAQFHVLDSRQYRSHQACTPAGRGGSAVVTASCTERGEAVRTMLGAEQEAWLEQGFATSQARWNFIAQQTLMAQCSHKAIAKPDGGRFWTDGWDGYPAARQRLLESLGKHRVSNPVVLSGDVHTFYAADLRADFSRPPSADNPLIATEFCTTSVTSSSHPQTRTEQYLAYNPHIRYGHSDYRGCMMMEVTPARVSVRFQGLDDVRQAGSGVSTLARFAVEDGKPGLTRTA